MESKIRAILKYEYNPSSCGLNYYILVLQGSVLSDQIYYLVFFINPLERSLFILLGGFTHKHVK